MLRIESLSICLIDNIIRGYIISCVIVYTVCMNWVSVLLQALYAYNFDKVV